jgi:hypothetical protein
MIRSNLLNDGFNAAAFEVQNKYTETSFLFVIQRLASPAGCIAKFFEIRDNARFLAIEKPND